jgi:hypothetical protein
VSAPPDAPPRGLALGLCLACVGIGAAVRIPPCFNDLWLDEIWSYFLARRLSSALEVFTRLHESNNNHLNTLFLYWLGDREAWAVYRLPAFAAGVGTVAVAAAVAWRRGRLEAVIAAMLTAFSFTLIHFSSEARGYSLAVFFALCAYAALERDLERSRGWCKAVFGAGVLLGTLSHLVALFFYAGALVYSGRTLLRERSKPALRRLAGLHLAPALGLTALYAVDLRHLRIDAAPHTPLDAVLARTFGTALGWPVLPALAPVYAVLGAGILIAGLRLLRRERDDAWLLFLFTVAVAPLAAFGVLRPEAVAVRYFTVPVAFGLLLTAYLLADWIRAEGWRRAVSVVALALFLLGNATHTRAFLEHGRGGYLAALRLMARETDGPRIVAGGDHDFRTGMVLRFYARLVPDGKQLVYHDRDSWPPSGPDWFIREHPSRPLRPPAIVTDATGNRFTLAAEFDHAAISGLYWAVYRNANPSADGSE